MVLGKMGEVAGLGEESQKEEIKIYQLVKFAMIRETWLFITLTGIERIII